MSNTVDTYLNLITSEHEGKPDFEATLTTVLSPLVRIQDMLTSMVPIFDLDLPPVGNQLDIIGQWVGVTRYVAIPITGVLFSWDDVDSVGWDYGVWQDPNIPATTVTALPDDAYLVLIRAKIAANSWDGTTEGAYAIYSFIFPGVTVLIQDGQNMTFAIIITGSIIDSLTQALLVGGYLPLKPEGVRITAYYLPFDTGPVFGWDLENTSFQGWETGSWSYEMVPT